MVFIDLSNFRCPLPLVKTKLALKKATSGEQLHLILSDRNSKQDVPKYLKQKGYMVEESTNSHGHLNLFVTII